MSAAREDQKRLADIKQVLHDTPAADPAIEKDARSLEARLRDILLALEGDKVMAARQEPTAPGITDRIDAIIGTQWSSVSAPTQTSRDGYAIAAEEFGPVLEKLRQADKDLASLGSRMEAAGAPWTPGRVPTWRPE